MIYRIYKKAGRIGTEMEKIEDSLMTLPNSAGLPGNQTPLAELDKETNTIFVFNDKIVDVTSLVQKFKNHCDLPNNHQFSIVYR